MPFSQEKSEAAFSRIHELGGQGVWESEMVVVNLDGCELSDDDLALFQNFDFVQMLLLSNTQISDAAIPHLVKLQKLTSLTIVNTNLTDTGIANLRKVLPNTTIDTEPLSDSTINPFTGLPIRET